MTMKYANTVIDLVGNTPLVRLNSVTDGAAPTRNSRRTGSTPA